MSHTLDSPAHLLRIAQVFVTNRSQLGIQFIQNRYPGRDVEVHDVVIADIVEVLHQGPQAVAVSGDEHSLPARMAGAMLSCQYGRNRATVSFKHSVRGSSWSERPA